MTDEARLHLPQCRAVSALSQRLPPISPRNCLCLVK